MKNTMIVRLKTLKQIKTEFRTYMSCGDIHFREFSIYIDKNMFEYFGKEIELNTKLRSEGNEKYYGKDSCNWYFLKEWIQPDKFIKDDEFKTKEAALRAAKRVYGMTKREFLKAIKRYRNTRIIPKDIDHWDISTWYRHVKSLKSLTRHISFGCTFDGEGICQGIENCRNPNSPACCCQDCRNSFGYLDLIDRKDIDEYYMNFDDVYGFWREGKGCILHRSLRSNTCITFACSTVSKLDHQLNLEMSGLRDAILALEDKITRNLNEK